MLPTKIGGLRERGLLSSPSVVQCQVSQKDTRNLLIAHLVEPLKKANHGVDALSKATCMSGRMSLNTNLTGDVESS